MFLKNTSKLISAVFLLFLFLPLSSWAQVSLDDCDNDFVFEATDGRIIIDVFPTGSDDTANIQCALNVAANLGVPIVRLSPGDFNITSLLVDNFNGSLQGTTRASTRLFVFSNGIDCAAMESQGLTPAAIKFSRGEPSLKFMQVIADSPCMSGDSIETLIHFTGKSAFDPSCGNSVINGRVDRVDIFGPGRDGDVDIAIAAAAEGDQFGGCNDSLLGGLKVNFSSISNTLAGIATAMRAGAQVDINFTTFNQTAVGVGISDSNQSTTITTNEFFSDDLEPSLSSSVGIFVVATLASPPAKTRLVIDNNKFNFNSTQNDLMNAIRVSEFDDGTQAVSLAVTNNTFNLSGSNTTGVWCNDLNNPAISANVFNGSGIAAIVMEVTELASVSGATITANRGLGAFAEGDSDIFIGSGVMQTIVGPGQNAIINDNGTDSELLSSTPADNDTRLMAVLDGKTPKAGSGISGNRLSNRADSLSALIKQFRKN